MRCFCSLILKRPRSFMVSSLASLSRAMEGSEGTVNDLGHLRIRLVFSLLDSLSWIRATCFPLANKW